MGLRTDQTIYYAVIAVEKDFSLHAVYQRTMFVIIYILCIGDQLIYMLKISLRTNRNRNNSTIGTYLYNITIIMSMAI